MQSQTLSHHMIKCVCIYTYIYQVNEYKQQMDLLQSELQSAKRKYFEQKRRETLAKEKELDLLSELAPRTSKPFKDQSNKTRFVGGGFAIK